MRLLVCYELCGLATAEHTSGDPQIEREFVGGSEASGVTWVRRLARTGRECGRFGEATLPSKTEGLKSTNKSTGQPQALRNYFAKEPGSPLLGTQTDDLAAKVPLTTTNYQSEEPPEVVHSFTSLWTTRRPCDIRRPALQAYSPILPWCPSTLLPSRACPR